MYTQMLFACDLEFLLWLPSAAIKLSDLAGENVSHLGFHHLVVELLFYAAALLEDRA